MKVVYGWRKLSLRIWEEKYEVSKTGTVEDRGAGLSAISLIPLHPTKYSHFWGKMAIMVFRFGWRMFLSSSVIGLAYVFAVAFIYWPVTNPILLGIFWVITAVLAFTGLVIFGRTYKAFVPKKRKLILK